MITEFRFGEGGSKHKHFMEWRCCNNIWQLQMWRGQMFRRDWSPQCKCGEAGLTFNQFLKLKEDN
jgi:hypothetical protein